MNTDLDTIGKWSEIKLEIIRKFAQAYTQILNKQRLHFSYIDGFAGAGVHISKEQKTIVPGSPLNALLITPPFNEYHLVDLDRARTENLEELRGDRKNVHIYNEDCNVVLLNEILPQIRYDQYRRALCVLDPYGLQLNWEVLALAGRLKTVDVFLNFPIMDINRNVLRRDPGQTQQDQIARLNAFWGDESWRAAAYSTEDNLFGYEEKTGNEAIVNAFRERLKEVAGFQFVPPPLPMRNSKNAVVYYLFFASKQQVAEKIAKGIFKKYGGGWRALMSANSSIEWTESTWNPVTGCTKISAGCRHCYAERMARRLQAMGQANYADGFKVALHEQALELPLIWRKPQTIFVNSMSDLFHRSVPTEFILKVFDVMLRAHWHQYQVLTKRADRLESLDPLLPWAPHIWMGVSVEDQACANRIDHLRRTGARLKFISFEPLIGPVSGLNLAGIQWAIVGGESGPGARPMEQEWVTSLRDQCLNAGTAFFFKQWGGFRKKKNGRLLEGRTWDEMPASTHSPKRMESDMAIRRAAG